jgi:hypothetical protein
VAEAVRAARRSEAQRPARAIPFGGRFAAAYALLVVAFGGGLLVLALLASGGSDDNGPPWSAWKPAKTGFAAAGEIATHVSKQYRTAAEGQQLVAVQAYPPQFNTIPLSGIATRDTTDNGLSTGGLTVRPSDRTLVYVLCGVAASRCALPPAAQVDDVVLRREAVELSLYAMKYLKGVDSVVTFLPPPDTQTLTAVYLRRSDVRANLQRPLAQTLPLAATPPIDREDPGEQAAIERLTRPHWYTTSLQRGAGGTTLLVLNEPVGGASSQ